MCCLKSVLCVLFLTPSLRLLFYFFIFLFLFFQLAKCHLAGWLRSKTGVLTRRSTANQPVMWFISHRASVITFPLLQNLQNPHGLFWFLCLIKKNQHSWVIYSQSYLCNKQHWHNLTLSKEKVNIIERQGFELEAQHFSHCTTWCHPPIPMDLIINHKINKLFYFLKKRFPISLT